LEPLSTSESKGRRRRRNVPGATSDLPSYCDELPRKPFDETYAWREGLAVISVSGIGEEIL
jgi:cation diffusion facilitator CzcD-associated flavoprotein CzcO